MKWSVHRSCRSHKKHKEKLSNAAFKRGSNNPKRFVYQIDPISKQIIKKFNYMSDVKRYLQLTQTITLIKSIKNKTIYKDFLWKRDKKP